MTSTIDTISELLSLSNTQFRVFDIGRKITKLPKEIFQKVELNQLPYPHPIQGHAMLALAFWQNTASTPYLWFVKLPLDERGLLVQASRNHFIAIIIEALGTDLSVDPTEKQEELLQANPYHFTPASYKLAALNSILKVELKQPLSIHYEYAEQYLSGKHSWQDWPNIGLQGLCDIASKISEKSISESFILHADKLPAQVLHPLCIALENQPLSHGCIDTIISLYNEINPLNTQHLIRALSSSTQHPHVQQFVDTLLSSEQISNDCLITLVGRCWLVFDNTERLQHLLERLANENNIELFTAIFKDLVAIPIIRPHVFTVMRSEQRSPQLAAAIGQLFNAQ